MQYSEHRLPGQVHAESPLQHRLGSLESPSLRGSRMPTVGDRVREIRETKKWTQDQLATKSGVSKGFLSDIENNKRNPSAEYVLKIANALGASIDYLLRGDEPLPVLHREPTVIPQALASAAEQLKLSY